jgi:hypothetical protein
MAIFEISRKCVRRGKGRDREEERRKKLKWEERKEND